MKGITSKLSTAINPEIAKNKTALIPEKKSNCGKCKVCSCQLSPPIVLLANKDKKE